MPLERFGAFMLQASTQCVHARARARMGRALEKGGAMRSRRRGRAWAARCARAELAPVRMSSTLDRAHCPQPRSTPPTLHAHPLTQTRAGACPPGHRHSAAGGWQQRQGVYLRGLGGSGLQVSGWVDALVGNGAAGGAVAVGWVGRTGLGRGSRAAAAVTPCGAALACPRALGVQGGRRCCGGCDSPRRLVRIPSIQAAAAAGAVTAITLGQQRAQAAAADHPCLRLAFTNHSRVTPPCPSLPVKQLKSWGGGGR